jgi:hypothetical protein
MFDPLGSENAGFGSDISSTPPWPSTPHLPGSPIPNLRRAPSPVPPTPDKGPSTGLYGKEPQIYGQPEPGLISPQQTNGTKYEKVEPYLRVRITGLDRNRRDILVKFDAQVWECPHSSKLLLECGLIADKLIQLYWNDVPQCVTIILRVPTIL